MWFTRIAAPGHSTWSCGRLGKTGSRITQAATGKGPGARPSRPTGPDQRAESMTTIKAMRLASLVTAINVLVASGFSIAAIIRLQYLVAADSVPTEASLLLAMYAAARTIPLALFALAAIYKRAAILGALAGAMQLLDAG